MKELLLKLKKSRLALGYTQDYMASQLGISQNAYSKIELGYTDLTISRLQEIVNIIKPGSSRITMIINQLF